MKQNGETEGMPPPRQKEVSSFSSFDRNLPVPLAATRQGKLKIGHMEVTNGDAVKLDGLHLRQSRSLRNVNEQLMKVRLSQCGYQCPRPLIGSWCRSIVVENDSLNS